MNHAEICRAAATSLKSVPAALRPDVMVGFDGFVDYIMDVVAKRDDATSYRSIPTIADLGKRISDAAGKSANLELVIKQSKIGGNGPIMANAMCSLDCHVTSVGLLGGETIDPVFAPLASRARKVVSLGPPASTDALEFTDGKIMLNRLLPMDAITYDRFVAKAGGIAGAKDLFRSAKGIATVNWTMTMGLTDIWRGIAKDILPGLRPDRPLWFIDLADPAKRTVVDIQAAMAAMAELQKHADVVLGLNEAECRQMLAVLGEKWPPIEPEWEAARSACAIIRSRLGLSWTMCHLVKSAAVAWSALGARAEGSVGVDGFFDPKPVITTGAGDHFNAGFFSALLAGIAPEHGLLIGGATSGFYVRTAVSPSRAQVIEFLEGRARG
ncbi:MAG: hypothetical protein H0V44_07130 [Planctomycetes bacterium]|nr:hypothetical protein [Planctomycetota bacterium]